MTRVVVISDLLQWNVLMAMQRALPMRQQNVPDHVTIGYFPSKL